MNYGHVHIYTPMALARLTAADGHPCVIAPLESQRGYLRSHYVSDGLSLIDGHACAETWVYNTEITAMVCDICLYGTASGGVIWYNAWSEVPICRPITICGKCHEHMTNHTLMGKTHTYVVTDPHAEVFAVICNDDDEHTDKFMAALSESVKHRLLTPTFTLPVKSSLSGDIFIHSFSRRGGYLHKCDSDERPIAYKLPKDTHGANFAARDRNTIAIVPMTASSPARIIDLRECAPGGIWSSDARITSHPAFVSEHILAISAEDEIGYYDIRSGPEPVFEVIIGEYACTKLV